MIVFVFTNYRPHGGFQHYLHEDLVKDTCATIQFTSNWKKRFIVLELALGHAHQLDVTTLNQAFLALQKSAQATEPWKELYSAMQESDDDRDDDTERGLKV